MRRLRAAARRRFAFGGGPRGAAAAAQPRAGAAAGAAATAARSPSRGARRPSAPATVCPSVTMISASTPADGAGISASTLSVEISKIGSSRFTSSPTFFSHLDSVPSAIDSPIWGMMTSTRATAISSQSEFASRGARLAAAARCTSVGSDDQRRSALPTRQYMCQLHGAPVSASARAPARRSPTDLRNQHGDHPAADEPDDGRQAADPKIRPDPVARLPRTSGPDCRFAHPQYAASRRTARTMSAVCGST